MKDKSDLQFISMCVYETMVKCAMLYNILDFLLRYNKEVKVIAINVIDQWIYHKDIRFTLWRSHHIELHVPHTNSMVHTRISVKITSLFKSKKFGSLKTKGIGQVYFGIHLFSLAQSGIFTTENGNTCILVFVHDYNYKHQFFHLSCIYLKWDENNHIHFNKG